MTDSPPNEFCLQQEDKSVLNLDEPVPITDQSYIAMNSLILDRRNRNIFPHNLTNLFSLDLLQRITGVIKRLFELKRSDKVN